MIIVCELIKGDINYGLEDKYSLTLREQGSWSLIVNLCKYFEIMPINKVRKLANMVRESALPDKGFSFMFEALDYLSKTCDNETREFKKRLQKINNILMGAQAFSRITQGG